jgi:hypothetical protein
MRAWLHEADYVVQGCRFEADGAVHGALRRLLLTGESASGHVVQPSAEA